MEDSFEKKGGFRRREKKGFLKKVSYNRDVIVSQTQGEKWGEFSKAEEEIL